MSRTRKILINTLRVILILLMLYLGYTGFPRTNEKLLKSKIFKNNSVEYSPAKPLDPDATAISFKTKHFDVACSGGGLIMIDYNHYYKDNNIYDYDSGNKVEDKKTTQMLNKELKEFTDKFGKNMGYQIYNPF